MSESRTRMLSHIRKSLESTRPHLERQAANYPPPHPRGPFTATDAVPLLQFQAELSALKGHVHICNGSGEALEQVLALLEAHAADEALAWSAAELPLPGLLDQLAENGIRLKDGQVLGKARQAQHAAVQTAQVGITGAQAAISESGSVLVLSGPERGRLTSLLPPIHIVLLPAERVVRTLPEAFDLVRQRYGDKLYQDHSNLVLITGPSRTGDIELSLTLGVHGPSEIHVIVIA